LYYKPNHSSCQDIFDKRTGSKDSKEAKKASLSGVYVNSARTTHNSKSIGKQVTTETSLLRKDFNADKFRALFHKLEDKRKTSEVNRLTTDLGFRSQAGPKSNLNLVPRKKDSQHQHRKTFSRDSNKSGKAAKNSHRDRSIKPKSTLHTSNGQSRSRDGESYRSSIPIGEFYSKHPNPELESKDIDKTRKTFLKSNEELSNLQVAQNFARTKTRESSKGEEQVSINQFEDLGFLFNKKLSNVEKMSLLKLRKNKLDLQESGKDIAKKPAPLVINDQLADYVKGNRLVTRMSASDSNRSSRRVDKQRSSAHKPSDSFDSNKALEAELEAHNSSNYHQHQNLTNHFNDNFEIPSRHQPSHKSPTYSKKVFGRRKSFCEERGKERLEKEVKCNLGASDISMTSGFSCREDDSYNTIGYQGGSDLHRSNSELLLRSMISSVSNSRTDTSSKMMQVEQERANLIAYISSYTKKNGKVPKTTLQFFKIIRLIGKGSFGKVHLGLHLLTRHKVAIKCIDKEYIMEEKAQNKVVQEVTLLKGMSHKNIIKILEVFENKKYVFIVTDFAEKGDLLQYMKEHGVFREQKAKPIIAQVLNGLDFCHSRGIMHRDVKLDNILLDRDLKVKICDFGVSRVMPKNGQPIKERCGTPAYIAPEIIKNQGYSGFLADVRAAHAGVESRNPALRYGHGNHSLQSEDHPRTAQTDHRVGFRFSRLREALGRVQRPDQVGQADPGRCWSKTRLAERRSRRSGTTPG